jgi:hypothetical protein
MGEKSDGLMVDWKVVAMVDLTVDSLVEGTVGWTVEWKADHLAAKMGPLKVDQWVCCLAGWKAFQSVVTTDD